RFARAWRRQDSLHQIVPASKRRVNASRGPQPDGASLGSHAPDQPGREKRARGLNGQPGPAAVCDLHWGARPLAPGVRGGCRRQTAANGDAMSGRQGAPERRVVITGLGVVTPIGSDVEAFWQGALAGASAVRRITRFDASGFRSRIAAEIDHVCLDGWVEPKRAKWLDRYSALALLAGLQAIRDGGLEGKLATVRERAGVYVGSAL